MIKKKILQAKREKIPLKNRKPKSNNERRTSEIIIIIIMREEQKDRETNSKMYKR